MNGLREYIKELIEYDQSDGELNLDTVMLNIEGMINAKELADQKEREAEDLRKKKEVIEKNQRVINFLKEHWGLK